MLLASYFQCTWFDRQLGLLLLVCKTNHNFVVHMNSPCCLNLIAICRSCISHISFFQAFSSLIRGQFFKQMLLSITDIHLVKLRSVSMFVTAGCLPSPPHAQAHVELTVSMFIQCPGTAAFIKAIILLSKRMHVWNITGWSLWIGHIKVKQCLL